MEALGTSPYPLTIDGRVDLLEVEPGSRGSIPLPLAVDSACGTITGGTITGGTITCGSACGTTTGSSACGTITGGSTCGSACGTTTGGSACGTTTGGGINLDRDNSRAKQLFPIVLEVSLIISTQARHSVVVVDGVTLVLIVG
jgi:hypothetical protein